MVQLYFIGDLNSSVQVGDTAYHVDYAAYGLSEFDTNTTQPIVIGTVKEITTSVTSDGAAAFTIDVQESGAIDPPTETSFIFFSKENKVNISKLTGYYGKAEFKNNSTTKAELFATSCEMHESSK